MSSDDDEKGWVLPSQIPFDELKGYALEECLFWLIDGMGARDIAWRLGGVGSGAADGGRDLEARFYVPDVDGQMIARRWWVECKGRTGTLEADAVKVACNNVVGDGNVDCLVIATNTTFTNPTRDWVEKWQERFPRPQILLWDRTSLERMLSQQPATVLRLFEGGLSSSGYVRALRDRFWNLLEYSSIERLKRVWIERDHLDLGVMERFALIANEFAHGSIDERPWAGACKPEEVLQTFQYGMFNLVYLYTRIMKTGVDQGPVVRTLAYLLLATVRDFHPDLILEIFKVTLRTDNDEPMPIEGVEFFVMPILDSLRSDLQLVCSSDCGRFSRDDSLKYWEDCDPFQSYWSRFGTRGKSPKSGDGAYHRLERTTEPCRIGFDIGDGGGCPLYQVQPEVGALDIFLSKIAHVVRARAPGRRNRRERPGAEDRS
ncbi:restriction endonuclease [Agrobacterium sp. B1(2019)]|uniref:restriction endonuclease n=1 Tax=Agrobacterium sp. B1(2019) TaxID=2607032 RepID=UPI0011EDF8FA|nr:restriction endonuclease [Agrobacterium sp. B1(2019)]TZG32411.1 restriction endonuclease [Agrobacterium sp. B1(2019)]